MNARIAIVLTSLLVVASVPAALAQGSAPSTTFNEQNSGGHSVVVQSADMPEDGFLTIHDASLLQGKALESVIGVSSFLTPGAHANVRIQLTRPLTGANETLIAMPHKDTNDNHLYDFVSSGGTADGPFKGGPNAIPESFFVQNAPALAGKGLGDISAVPKLVNNTAYLATTAQTNSGRSIILDHVDLSTPGYVAIHDATLVASPGANGINGNNVLTSVIGVSDLLQAGEHYDVVVRLNNNCGGCKTDGNMTGTLIPMAHKETGGNATKYDFVASGGTQDGPFTGQPGAPLTAVINVADVTYSGVATETFPAQATGGHIVIFPQVFLPQGGYAAVHDETLLEGEVLGSVIGVSPFLAPGVHKNVSVELNFGGKTGITKSQTLVGMLHRETNGNTNYDFVSTQGAQDGPYTGGPNSLSEAQLPAGLKGKGLGGVNAVPAEATLAATVRLAPNQVSDGSKLRVEYADFSTAGFVALHDESLLANPNANVLTSVVGVSRSITGLQRNLEITLPGTNCGGCSKGALNVSQTLIAMPHKDSDGNGAYDFITSQGAKDGPFTTAAAASNTVNALSLNIVVALGHQTVPVKTASASTPTPTPTGNAPTPSPTDDEMREQPGFEVAFLVAAIAIGLLVMRRRK